MWILKGHSINFTHEAQFSPQEEYLSAGKHICMLGFSSSGGSCGESTLMTSQWCHQGALLWARDWSFQQDLCYRPQVLSLKDVGVSPGRQDLMKDTVQLHCGKCRTLEITSSSSIFTIISFSFSCLYKSNLFLEATDWVTGVPLKEMQTSLWSFNFWISYRRHCTAFVLWIL